jgi:hypothetical protein
MSAFTDERVAELSKAFDLVKDPSHWKGPVRGHVEGEDVKDVIEAITFYTATVGHVYGPLRSGPHKGLFRIIADGYWAGPAGG